MTTTTTDTVSTGDTVSTDTQDTQQQGQAPAGAPASAPAAPTPTPADVAAQGAAQPAKVEDLPEWAQREIREARDGEAKARTNAKAQAAQEAREQLLGELAPALKALGIDVPGHGEQITPEQLTQQATEAARERDEARDDARAARVELAVYRAATDHRADAQALLDSRAFTNTLADVDPTDSEAVDGAIKDFVSKNPRFLTQAVGSSSADHAGGSGEGAITKEQFQQMSGHERNELFRRDPATYNRLAGRA